MKNLLKILLTVLISIIFIYTPVKGVELLNIDEEDLKEIGFKDEYANNIMTYLDDMSLSKEEFSNVEETVNNVINKISKEGSIDNFSISEGVSIYNDLKGALDDLGLDVDFSIWKRTFAIKDEKNNNILLKGKFNDLQKYYDNYKSLLEESTGDNVTQKFDFTDKVTNNSTVADNNISNNDDTKSSENKISSNILESVDNSIEKQNNNDIAEGNNTSTSKVIPIIVATLFTLSIFGIILKINKA